MTPLGWIFLTVSLTFVWGLTAWCFFKVMTVRLERDEPSDQRGG